MFYTFVWASEGKDIHLHVPLQVLSNSVAKTGTTGAVLNIVFLEGIEHVPAGYLDTISNQHVLVINYQEEFARIRKEYKEIFDYYSVFESYCLLRWICLRNLAREKDLKQVWHIDSDVVLHTSLDVIVRDTKGKTFMLDGCPVLLSISNFQWFDIYLDQLKKLLNDPKDYSDMAFKAKPENRKRDTVLCNQTLYRNPIGSDQDLLQWLIGSQLLPQEQVRDIFSGDLFYSQNALQLSAWKEFDDQWLTQPIQIEDGKLVLSNGMQIPFTHFQGNFVTFCNLYYFLYRMNLPNFLIRRVLFFRIEDEKFRISKAAYILRVFMNRAKFALPRNRLIHRFIQDNNKLLLKVLNFLVFKN